MKKEKSCGAVIIKDNKVLLIKQTMGHWSFPKGHVERKETEEETALREIKEETNLDVILDTAFREVSTYSPKEGVIKDVIIFIARPVNNDIKPQLEEVSEIKYLKKEEALNTITYEDDKKILIKAFDYLDNKSN